MIWHFKSQASQNPDMVGCSGLVWVSPHLRMSVLVPASSCVQARERCVRAYIRACVGEGGLTELLHASACVRQPN